MAEPDSTKNKQKKAGDKAANVAHIVTPDPDNDPQSPKLRERSPKDREVDASPKSKYRRGDDGGPMHVGVDFDASEK